MFLVEVERRRIEMGFELRQSLRLVVPLRHNGLRDLHDFRI